MKAVGNAARLKQAVNEGSQESPTKEREVEVGNPGPTSTSSSSPLSSTTVSGGGSKDSGGGSPEKPSPEEQKPNPAADLIQEATSLLKTLRAMKTMRIKQVSAHPEELGSQHSLHHCLLQASQHLA